MNIGLIDVDGHNFPNLALMKISAFHKRAGDRVEWATIGEDYDKTYMSKVFTFTPDFQPILANLGEVQKGGTGYNIHKNLPDEVDKMCPDYSIYPQYHSAFGFLTRGCCNKCDWCIVPQKEGKIRAYSDIEEWIDGRSEAILMDNNILAHEHGISQLYKIAQLGIKIDINQGLEAKLITEEIANLLSRIKWIRYIRMACDTKSAMPAINNAVELLAKNNVKPYKIFVYVLIRDIEDALFRINFLKKLGVTPFAQPYRDFRRRIEPTKEQKRLARWCNIKSIFNTVDFSNYK